MFCVVEINMYLKLFLICALSLAVTSQEQERLKVTLFFEGLCPYCHDFINKQLYPGLQKLGSALDVDLVTTQSHKNNGSKIEWVCYHGPLECYINKVSACAIYLSETQSQMMEFINCFMKDSDMDKSKEYEEQLAKKCAAESNFSWDKINSCFNEKGDQLLLANEQRKNQAQPPIKFVPSILFNDKFDEDISSAAEEDFMKTACQLFKTKPLPCLFC